MPPNSRPLAFAFAALAAALPAASASAAVVNVPPVTITAIEHRFTGSSAEDWVTIPGPGYTSSGFTAAFGTGDVVRVRIQPPPGKKFQVRAPVRGPEFADATGAFKVNVYWPCAGGGISRFDPATCAFENFRGFPTSLQYSLAAANEVLVEAWYEFVTTGDFEFTAFVVDIPVDQALVRVPRTYGDVLSWASPSIGASSPAGSAGFRAFEIVDDGTVPATPASWGRVKALYR